MPAALKRQEDLPRQLGTLRRRKLEANLGLLGDTISITDDDWQRPSALPGWTRAHVASHLARNADALRRLIQGVEDDVPVRMYPSERARVEDIERGSERGALELQIDLDTSSGQLSKALLDLDRLPGDALVDLGGAQPVRLDLLPLARLNEVVLHHIDLQCGFTVQRVDAEVARLLLEWNSYWIADRPDYPALEVVSESGFQARLGASGDPLHVSGADNLLLGWLTGRLPLEHVESSQLPLLPLYA